MIMDKDNNIQTIDENHKITRPAIEAMIQKIVDNINPEKIILFGSWVSGAVTPDSDIDLLIILNTHLCAAERQRLVSRLLYPRVAPMDIVVKTPAEIQSAQQKVDPFIHEILRNGIVLYARS